MEEDHGRDPGGIHEAAHLRPPRALARRKACATEAAAAKSSVHAIGGPTATPAVSAAGGSNNAYTAAEETNYYFDIQGGALPDALSRFAAFFTSPSFTESATAREVNAIESEHSKNLQSDYW